MSAWKPQDEMEKSLVEQIAVNQWKLARLDAVEAALASHRICLTQARLERAISNTIADLERCRKIRLARAEDQRIQENRHLENGAKSPEILGGGL
jgi:hypothetical protein